VADPREIENHAQSGRSGIGLVVLAIGFGVGFWWLIACRSEPAVTDSAVKGTLHLETFVLNRADPEQRSYLRVGIDLGLSREVGKGEHAPPVAEVRDTILTVLGQAQVDDLLTEKGKAKLKADVLHALKQRIPGLGVEEVYFTEFLIQR
jgi:flagellar basal body-associated protein FliL